MIPKLKDILELLEKVAPLRLAEPWDNPGLQVGSYSQEIKKIFLALDPTKKALKSASENNAQLLLTHHPLIFKPLSQIDIHAFPGDVLFEAVKSEISIVSAHTNLDMARGGINDILADLLGLQHVEVLKEIHEEQGVGLGRIGVLPGPTGLSVVIEQIKRILGTEKLKIIGKQDIQISRLAVVGGSGGGLVSIASKKGAELLLTGDVGHHHALEALSLGLVLIDGGHFHTEKTAFKVFGERLQVMLRTKKWEVAVEVDKDETDPMNDR